MKKILILAEHKNGVLKKASEELLGASRGHEVTALIFGLAAKSAAEDLAKKGVQRVHWVKNSSFDSYHPDAYAEVFSQVIDEEKPWLVLSTASSLGKDLLPKMAARLDRAIATDATELTLEPLKVRRPFFSGKALAELEFEPSPLQFISMRPNSFPAGVVSPVAGQIKEMDSPFDFARSNLQFISKSSGVSDKPDLTEASIIISGGRSLKTKENFKILFDLASELGAAVGASRAAVDEGLASHDMQVGQTGKTVNPDLYIACGISGAIQHLAGMRTSKVIVAINKDAAAPLFTKANYGIVGDLFTLVPLITQEVKKLLHKA